eukprot:344514_1
MDIEDDTISDDFAVKLAAKLPATAFTALCQDVPSIGHLVHLIKSTPQNTNRRTRRRLSDACAYDGLDWCSYSSPDYTDGDHYSNLLNQLNNPDMSAHTILEDGSSASYTDGNAVTRVIDDVHIGQQVMAAAREVCDVASDCAYAVVSMDITGGGITAACTTQAACVLGVTIWTNLVEGTRLLLDKADHHDDVLITTQLNTIFEDRKRIIANQKHLVKEIETASLSATNKIETNGKSLKAIKTVVDDIYEHVEA